MIQLILHLLGDYITQSDWMAQNKTKRSYPCLCHCVLYSLPFLLIGSPLAVAVIFATHFIIDRWRLARFVVYAKNVVFHPGSSYPLVPCSDDDWRDWMKLKWADCSSTGYHKDSPPWLSVWLLIAADNTLHLLCNYAALRWL